MHAGDVPGRRREHDEHRGEQIGRPHHPPAGARAQEGVDVFGEEGRHQRDRHMDDPLPVHGGPGLGRGAQSDDPEVPGGERPAEGGEGPIAGVAAVSDESDHQQQEVQREPHHRQRTVE